MSRADWTDYEKQALLESIDALVKDGDHNIDSARRFYEVAAASLQQYFGITKSANQVDKVYDSLRQDPKYADKYVDVNKYIKKTTKKQASQEKGKQKAQAGARQDGVEIPQSYKTWTDKEVELLAETIKNHVYKNDVDVSARVDFYEAVTKTLGTLGVEASTRDVIVKWTHGARQQKLEEGKGIDERPYLRVKTGGDTPSDALGELVYPKTPVVPGTSQAQADYLKTMAQAALREMDEQ